MKKIAVIGASYLQNPLILKAKSMGIETHVFAWECGDIGEKTADFFYPVSIVEKEKILDICRDIGIDGICSIATDLGSITVNYVAQSLGLAGNSAECTEVSTNKHLMRKMFELNGDPSPKSRLVSSAEEAKNLQLDYPIIVKPTDRSGSRGITKLFDANGLDKAVKAAISQSFEKKALVEEFAEGDEYSVECISFHGEHYFLNMTKKFTTGAPHFIETGHLEPAPIDEELLSRVKSVVFHALDSLKIKNSASHSELKIDASGKISIIEIGGRMGGDCIGSDLVYLSTGIDFVRAVIQVALGEKPDITPVAHGRPAAIRFVFTDEDIETLKRLKKEHPEYLVREENITEITGDVTDSSMRFGAFLMCADSLKELEHYLP